MTEAGDLFATLPAGRNLFRPAAPSVADVHAAVLRETGARPCQQPASHELWASPEMPKYCMQPGHWSDGPRHAGADGDVLLFPPPGAGPVPGPPAAEVDWPAVAQQADEQQAALVRLGAELANARAVLDARTRQEADARAATRAALDVVHELESAGTVPAPAEHDRPGLAAVRQHVADLAGHWGSWRSSVTVTPSARERARVVADVLGDVLGFIDGEL